MEREKEGEQAGKRKADSGIYFRDKTMEWGRGREADNRRRK